MKFRLVVFIIYLITSFSSEVKGQENIIQNENFYKLSQNEKLVFRQKVNDLVKELEDYIIVIADKEESSQRRLDAIDQAIRLFAQPELNKVEVSYKSTDTIIEHPVKNYFHRLYGIKAKQVKITFYKVARLDSLRRHTDGKYYGTAYVYQRTQIFYNDQINPGHVDDTVKKILIELEPNDDWLTNRNMPKYTAKLSDITVVETL